MPEIKPRLRMEEAGFIPGAGEGLSEAALNGEWTQLWLCPERTLRPPSSGLEGPGSSTECLLGDRCSNWFQPLLNVWPGVKSLTVGYSDDAGVLAQRGKRSQATWKLFST